MFFLPEAEYIEMLHLLLKMSLLLDYLLVPTSLSELSDIKVAYANFNVSSIYSSAQTEVLVTPSDIGKINYGDYAGNTPRQPTM